MHQDSFWKMMLGVVILLFFVGIGIAHVVNPDRFARSSGVRKGGEILTKWNRDGFRVAGAVFAAVAIYMLYKLFSRALTQR
jgi:hypothetical protein